MTTPVPGPPASVLSAILVANPDAPGSPLKLATFSQSGEPPVLPSLMNDVVVMPQDGLLDANGTWTGFLATQGLTGATAATRWVGSTAAGAPTAGTFDAGDFITSQDGNAYICTAPGSPGTWVASGGAPSGTAGGDLGGTYPDPTVVSVAHVTAGTLGLTHGGTGATSQNFANLLTPTGTKTAAYTASPGDFVPCDTNSVGAFTVTLPAAPAGLTAIGIKMIKQSGTNAVTIAAGGSDVFNVAGGATSLTLNLLFQGVLLQYRSSGAIWYVFSDDLPLGALDSRYVASVSAGDTSVVIGGSASAPTVETGTLDVIAADHPPAANWSNNSHKITSVANGGAAQDAAAWGQTVSGVLTTVGDTVYENSTPAPARLAGNTTAQKMFLNSTGTGSAANAPAWATVSGQYLRAPTIVTTGTTYTTTSATFAAIAPGTVGTGSFIAPSSGEVVIEVDVVLNTSVATTYGFALATTATVTPIVGNVIGGEASSSTPYQPTHLCFPVTSLTGGTSYNYDVLFATVSGTLSCPSLGSANTTVTANNKGAPIVVAVKAV